MSGRVKTRFFLDFAKPVRTAKIQKYSFF